MTQASDRATRPIAAMRQLRNALRTTRYGFVLGIANRLTLLARVYGETDKWHHGYLPRYVQHFSPMRFRKNVILEIGVGGYEGAHPGGSLRVWREYFPRSKIVGVDLYEKDVRLGRRVAFVRADQGDRTELLRACEPFGSPNIVIDDGSHLGADVLASFDLLWPRLPAGSIYVIEDLSTSYYPAYGGGFPPSARTAVGLLRELIDSAQAHDNTFRRMPHLGPGPNPAYPDVRQVCVYPGIAFVHKS